MREKIKIENDNYKNLRMGFFYPLKDEENNNKQLLKNITVDEKENINKKLPSYLRLMKYQIKDFVGELFEAELIEIYKNKNTFLYKLKNKQNPSITTIAEIKNEIKIKDGKIKKGDKFLVKILEDTNIELIKKL